jgi:YspA, cpYpsA-related SLOG family
MKIVVCGGRDFADVALFNRTLDRLHKKRPITMVLHGGALGADDFAGDWARRNGIPYQVFYPHWVGEGKAAGPLRNGRMLDERPDLLVAFPGGRGTADCIRQAAMRKISTFVVDVGGKAAK